MLIINLIEQRQDQIIIKLRSKFLESYVKKDRLILFNISFIDIMACGLGAIALILV